MPKWKKDATEFSVSVYFHPTRGIQCFLPKPVYEILGRPERVTFLIKGKKIQVIADTAKDSVEKAKG